MDHKKAIKNLTIKGYKTIGEIEQFPLSELNVLIGANGVGKSNFISFFHLLSELVAGRLQRWVNKQGGSDRLLSFGIKETSELSFSVRFNSSASYENGYDIELEPTIDEGFIFTRESVYYDGRPEHRESSTFIGSGYREARLESNSNIVSKFCYEAMSAWKVLHFHDTTDTASVKRSGLLHDNAYLRDDASNLAAFLYKLKHCDSNTYNKIIRTIRLAVPFFDDFLLAPDVLETEEKRIRLLWKQRNNDYPLWPSQLSDGTLRFMCLVTTLLQPEPPATIIIDEPELGLHPYAIRLLGALMRSAATKVQLIVATQSVPLLNEFELNDLIVVERDHRGYSTFNRLKEEDFQSWLEDYSVGELWGKNILGGMPTK